MISRRLHAVSFRFGRGSQGLLGLLVVFGVIVAAAPALAKAWDQRTQRNAGEAYVAASANPESVRRFSAAEQYNRDFPGQTKATYSEVLSLPTTDAVGRLLIESIDLDLPIYLHATDDVLDKGVGHVPTTHLPVGGPSTHALLSAHTGLPFATMFDNLTEAATGDLITIDVLGRELVYKVSDIQVVLPSEVLDEVVVEEGEDKITLLTCTPYGVNTHRLLVTGTRVADPAIKVPVPKGPGLFSVLGSAVAVGIAGGSTVISVANKRTQQSLRKV